MDFLSVSPTTTACTSSSARRSRQGRAIAGYMCPAHRPRRTFRPAIRRCSRFSGGCFPPFPRTSSSSSLRTRSSWASRRAACFWFVRSRFEHVRRRRGDRSRSVATLGIPTLTLSALVMSEPLFLALLIPTLLLAERVVERSDESNPRRRRAGIAHRCRDTRSYARHRTRSALSRSCCASRRRFRMRGALHCRRRSRRSSPWQLWVATHSGVVPMTMRGNYESYGAWFSSGLRAEGIRTDCAHGAADEPRHRDDVRGLRRARHADACSLRCSARARRAGRAGGARTAWRHARVSTVFLTALLRYRHCLALLPQRFLWCVWPLVIVLPDARRPRECSAGVRRREPRSRRGRRPRRVRVCSRCGYGVYNVRGYRHQWWSSIPRLISRNVHPLLVWVATHTPRNAVLATEAESAVYLYTGRSTVPVGTFTVDEYFARANACREPRRSFAMSSAYYRPKAVVVSSGSDARRRSRARSRYTANVRRRRHISRRRPRSHSQVTMIDLALAPRP